MSGVDVIIENVENHPRCHHGPTILFSRNDKGKKRNFYACSACRDRKQCNFFVYEDDFRKNRGAVKNVEHERIDHQVMFLVFNQILNLSESERSYCTTCDVFVADDSHQDHGLIKNVSDYSLHHPTDFLPPLEDAKKEAQFFFNTNTTNTLIRMIKQLNFKKVLCIGTPKIHETITKNHPKLTSLLLDFDHRFHNFFGPKQFCWYNCFNHHFFQDGAKEVYLEFLKGGKEEILLIMDPPFGGRMELLGYTINIINSEYKKDNSNRDNMKVFLISPYFMEPQVQNSLPDFTMLDYKVDYINHALFQQGPKGRKYGSPVRIFTNVIPSKVILPKDEGYKFCRICKRWVSQENQHCKICNSCTSKDGRTYVHCKKCERCVKPSWNHCKTCQRCAQQDHKCGKLEFTKECLNCNESGHKKRNCPSGDNEFYKKKKLN